MGPERAELTLFPEHSALTRAERNLEEYPLFELKARKRGSDARVYERVVDGEGGASLRQTWKVIPSGEYGMPGPVDQDVYLAVLRLLEQGGGMPEDGALAFSLYELRKVLGWSDDSGGAYKEIRDALVRIQLTGVQSQNAYYSAADEQLISDSFNVWSVHFAQRRRKGAGAGPGVAPPRARTTQDRHVLRFHPVFIRNYEAQYLKGLDADFFFGLRLPLSKRLYRLVDLQRAGGLTWRTDLFAVRDQVPLDYAYPSQIKRALAKAHAELEEKGFLSAAEQSGKTGLTYRVSPAFARRQKALELSGTPQEMFAIERLMREGVRGDTARELVVSRGAEACLIYADAMDAQQGVRNRASFLVAAIRKGYALPGPPPPAVPPGQETLDLEPGGGPAAVAPPMGPARAAPPHADPAAQELWEAVLEDAAGEIDESSLGVWFDGIVAVARDRDSLTISAPNPFAKEYIETRFKPALETSLRQRLSARAVLTVVVGAGF